MGGKRNRALRSSWSTGERDKSLASQKGPMQGERVSGRKLNLGCVGLLGPDVEVQ